jgi:transglutaminase-like putative cysteine protease
MEPGSGTCRVFAVQMMEALRSWSGDAFVTGYLYDDTSVLRAAAAHAWCSVYLPGADHHDPTNGLIAGANLVRVGATRGAEQALPISGGFIGSAADPSGLHVDVSVSAVPIDAALAAALSRTIHER